jgi:hypothetical protein
MKSIFIGPAIPQFSFIRSWFLIGILLLFILGNFYSCQPSNKAITQQIEEEFRNVPDSVKPWTYWYWISDNISKEGISSDLEGMAEIGIGTALIGNIGLHNVPAGDVQVLSEEWWDMMRWAVSEGKRTGVDIGIFNCPGWSQSGGPWITPDKTMRYLAHTETRVVGPQILKRKMPAPVKENFQDVALLAFPAGAVRENLLIDTEMKIRTPQNLKEVENIFDGDHNTSTLFGSSGHDDTTITLFIDLEKEIKPQSLTIFPANVPIYANFRFYAYETGKYHLVKETLIDRMNPQNIVGFEPYAPIALSLPEISSGQYKVEIEFIPSPRNIILKGGLREIELSKTPVLEYFKEKQLAKMNQIPWFYGHEYTWPDQAEPTSANGIINPQDIINLSDKVDKEGFLNWNVPEGEWIIQRIGMTPTGVTNHPTLPHATGPEADKMSTEAIHYHIDSYVGKFWESLPEEDRTAFKIVYVDSYETGSQNWTDELQSDFIEIYGYDPVPWLPVLSGKVIESVDQSNRFLWDLRRLIADFVAEKYTKGLRDASNERGLIFGLENVGHWGFPGETLLYGKYTDFQAGEFWNEGPLGMWENRIASSTAHIYGKNVVYCESYTAGGLPFQRSPMNLKKRGDWSYTEGINQTMLHLHILQPDEKLKPGINAGFGTEFNRHNTWYFMSKPWIDYLRRNNFLLQQGKYVADVAYYYGEDAPKITGYQNISLPKGYSFDYINYDVIMNYLDVKNGRFVLPDGMSYKVLVLPDSKTMRPEMLEKINDLVRKGGVIVGNAPHKSPSMKDYPASDVIVDSLASILWKDIEDDKNQSVIVGKGRIFKKMDLNIVFENLGMLPDFSLGKDLPVLFMHRTMPGMEIYFLTNQGTEEIAFDGTFRVNEMKPEWWSAIDGSVRSLPEYKSTATGIELPVRLGPLESGFVVFRKNDTGNKKGSNFPDYEKVKSIDDGWEVSFTDPFGITFNRTFNSLTDWRKSEEEMIKHFSGKAIYRTNFKMDISDLEENYYLNLGRVGVVAKVILNGKEVGGLWTAPWRINISEYLNPGANVLEIEVANNWNNRMVGDAELAAEERKSYAPVDIFKPGSPLQSSGLMGPVIIEKVNY